VAARKRTLRQRLDAAQRREKKATAEIKALYAESLQAAEPDKVCNDWIAETISRNYSPETPRKLPQSFDLRAIAGPSGEALLIRKGHSGRPVRVRPCDPELKDRTFFGIYLGDLALGVIYEMNRESGLAHARWSWHNPAIWVPSLGRIVMGMGSWWGLIKSEEDLKEITDDVIQDVWYVKALTDSLRGVDEKGEDPSPTR
jgi:hypothetical protein